LARKEKASFENEKKGPVTKEKKYAT